MKLQWTFNRNTEVHAIKNKHDFWKIYSGYAWIFKANLIDDTYPFVEYSLKVHWSELRIIKYELLKRSGYPQ